MRLDEFDPDDHEPVATHEADVTVEFEFYEKESEDWPGLEWRKIVVSTDVEGVDRGGDGYDAIVLDADELISEFGMFGIQLKYWLQGNAGVRE